jgi:hypothetical protein
MESDREILKRLAPQSLVVVHHIPEKRFFISQVVVGFKFGVQMKLI